jgi:hypothetical protein
VGLKLRAPEPFATVEGSVQVDEGKGVPDCSDGCSLGGGRWESAQGGGTMTEREGCASDGFGTNGRLGVGASAGEETASL